MMSEQTQKPLLRIVYNQDIRQPLADGIAHYIRNFIAAAGVPVTYVGPGAAGECQRSANLHYLAYGPNSFRLKLMPALLAVSWRLWRFAQSQGDSQGEVLWVQRSDLVLPFVLARWPGPIVLTIHGSSIHDRVNYRNVVKTATYSALESLALRRCTLIVLISRAAQDYYHSRFRRLRSRFVHIPTFYDDSVFYPLEDAQVPTGEPHTRTRAQQPLLLYVGRLHHAKRVDRALHTLTYYRRHSPGAQLIVAGHGEEQAALRKLATNLGIGESVHFVGALQAPALAELYRDAEALLLPSEFEGLPLTLLEALACGTPVLASAVGGIGELIRDGENGFVISDWNDATRISQCLDLLAKRGHTLRQRCSSSAAPFAASKVVPRLLRMCVQLASDTPAQ